MRKALLFATTLLFSSSRALASGFHIDEQDARATGRAGAVTASPANASTVYYNPAGIAELRGLHVDAGVSLVAPRASFLSAETGGETAADRDMFFLPGLYASYRIDQSLAAAVGFDSPFGLSLTWPASSPGRDVVRHIALHTYFLMPTLAANFGQWIPGLSAGAGVDLVPANVKLERDILFGSDVATVAVGATAFGVGARVGLMYRPKGLESLAIGLTYRSPIKLSFSGTADFDAPAIYRAQLPPDGDAHTSIVLPQTLDFGVAFRPLPEWELEVDGNWLGWKSFDVLTLELPGGTTSRLRRDWRNTYAVRVGTEYTVRDWWSARAGVIWDQGPVPDQTLDFQLPDADRVDLTLGMGAAIGHALHVDLGALYVLPAKHKTSNTDPYQPPNKGEYAVRAWVLNLTLGITLDPS